MGKRRGRVKDAAFMPALTGLFAFGTVVLAYITTLASGHMPQGVWTPPISMLGCSSPEHEVYQVGFLFTGILMLQCGFFWKKSVFPFLWEKNSKFVAFLALAGGFLAPIGAVGQGLVTLEEDFLSIMEEGRPMSMQSIAHQVLAAVFFLGTAVHCYAILFMAVFGETNFNSRSVRIKIFCVVVSMLSWPAAELLHVSKVQKPSSTRQINVGGMAQYITVFSYITFFMSYTKDISRASATIQPNKKKNA